MYRSFFGLKLKPFSKTPDPAFLYYGRHYEEALQRLLYAIEEREVALLTGDVGVGKTTLIQVLLQQLGAQQRAVSLIDPRLTPNQFLAAVVSGLSGGAPRGRRIALVAQLQDLLHEFDRRGQCPVVIVDEAQLLTRATMDEVRLLTNHQTHDRSLLAVVLVGQTELRRRLQRPEYTPLRQRIGTHHHLLPLQADEALAYVNHRLRRAGVRPTSVFRPDALDALHELTGGVPRVINAVCTNALVFAYHAHEKPISAATVRRAALETLGVGAPGLTD